MTTRQTPRRDIDADSATEPHPNAPAARRLESALPAQRSREDADAQYIAARNIWTAAMRRASSGRSADLASLAIAQEAYETAYAEREGWLSGNRDAVAIEAAAPRNGLEVFVNHDLAWRRVREARQKSPGRLERLVRRLAQRG
jgi:hypothetical protein